MVPKAETELHLVNRSKGKLVFHREIKGGGGHRFALAQQPLAAAGVIHQMLEPGPLWIVLVQNWTVIRQPARRAGRTRGIGKIDTGKIVDAGEEG